MNTTTKRTVIDIASISWAIIALLVWIQGYDFTKLGLSEQWIEAIKFIAAAIVIIFQSIKPNKNTDIELNVK